MLETIWQDLRHGMRMLAKNPGFSLVAILSIGIGVGANAAMFSVADGLMLRPLPVPNPNGLMTVSATLPTGEVRSGGNSYPDYADLRDRAQSFESLAAMDGVTVAFARRRDESARGTFGLAVSANFLDVMRIRPALGRSFLPDEDRVAGRDAVIILSHETWTQQFGGDPNIVGREIRLTGEPFTVIGVAPEGFSGPEHFLPTNFYVPLAMLPKLAAGAPPTILEQRDSRTLEVMGRLKDGVSLAQASEEVERIGLALAQEYPATNARRGLLLRTEMNQRMAESPPTAALSFILIGLAVAVLLVACANVAGLLTSRAPVRAREIAMRLAIGGGRGRLMRQLITESVLVTIAGAGAGLALGYLGILSFRQLQIISDVGVRLTYELDGRAVAVGLVIAVISVLLSSVIPAWRSTRARDLSSTLRNTTMPAGRAARLWGRHGLVASQIALTLVLLTVALSFYRAFELEYGSGPGFRTDHLLLTNVDTALARYDRDQSEAFYQRLKERAAAIPSVTSVALTSFVPLSQDGNDAMAIVPEGFTLPPGIDSLTVAAARVDEHYLDTIGVPIVSGRGIQAADTADTPRIAVVSSGMAARYWPGESPLGKRIRLAGPNPVWAEVVGVAANAKFRLFTQTSTPFLYLARQQNPPTRNTLVVRTDADSAALAEVVRSAVLETGRDVPILGMRTMEAFYYASARNINLVVVRTIAGMGAMGLALALIGLYGLMAYAVNRRTREIGIRMAMGALPGSVSRMILRQGTLPSIAGVAFGIVASTAVGGLIQGSIPGAGGDVVTYLLIVPVVVLVVMLAAYIPARRAAQIDPLRALRQD
jgi:putative ABC transport system permease protein